MRRQILSLTQHLFIGLSGTQLTEEEKEWLNDSRVGGVILFTRNYESRAQLIQLTRSIKSINPQLLISVDHEGGRVQRFREGFTRVPPMRDLGLLYDQDANQALSKARYWGQLIATELQEMGIDFSYAPVCDIDYGRNGAIGDRAFHSNPEVVSLLVTAFYSGLRDGGSIGIAKHFPGHGFVNIDTHLALATDDRSLDDLKKADLMPFQRLINAGVEGIMPAHIIYPTLDADYSAVSSRKWIDFLRHELGFEGVIISDDMDMQGAEHLGDVTEKVTACFDAGINIVLLCNNFEAIRTYLQ